MHLDQTTRFPAELFPGRATLSIAEFCGALGWNRARYYRHADKISKVQGYGVPMIPVSELDRIMGETGKGGAE